MTDRKRSREQGCEGLSIGERVPDVLNVAHLRLPKLAATAQQKLGSARYECGSRVQVDRLIPWAVFVLKDLGYVVWRSLLMVVL